MALTASAWVTHKQLGYWQDSISLWSHAAEVTENNFIAHDNLGEALVRMGRFDDALAHFRTAAQIEPNDPVAQINLGVLEKRRAKVSESIAHFESVLRLTSDPQLRAHTFTNLGS